MRLMYHRGCSERTCFDPSSPPPLDPFEIVTACEIRDGSYIVPRCGEAHVMRAGGYSATSDRDTRWPPRIAGNRNEVKYECSSRWMPVRAWWLPDPRGQCEHNVKSWKSFWGRLYLYQMLAHNRAPILHERNTKDKKTAPTLRGRRGR